MKTKSASLLVVILIITTQCLAQKTITVEAQSNDISNNLDLQAVASIFGESKDPEEFEMRLNDYDSKISNLDLNNDGEVDYLRVIEKMENNVHVVVIQAVLAKDVFQDVATIVVERNDNRRTHVQVIGDPYLYGDDYVIEPVYEYPPTIFSFFWGDNYASWNSPYYWGYYPNYYHQWHPFEPGIYLNNVSLHINRDFRYYRAERRQNENTERLYNSIGRNDYGNRFPDRSFTNRNQNIRNKYDIQIQRNSNVPALQTRSNYQGYESGSRNQENVYNTNRTRNSNMNGQNTYNRTYTPSGMPARNSEINRGQEVERNSRMVTNSNDNNTNVERNTNSVQNPNNGSYQTPSGNVSRETKTVTPDNNARTTPAVSQPTQREETKQVEKKQPENTRSKSVPNKRRRASRSER
jgi:hypothetical protein